MNRQVVPPELQETFAELREDYKRTKLNTPALVLANCMYKQITKMASQILPSRKLQDEQAYAYTAGTVP